MDRKILASELVKVARLLTASNVIAVLDVGYKDIGEDRTLTLTVTESNGRFSGEWQYESKSEDRKLSGSDRLYGDLSGGLADAIDDWAEKRLSSASIGYPIRKWKSPLVSGRVGTIGDIIKVVGENFHN